MEFIAELPYWINLVRSVPNEVSEVCAHALYFYLQFTLYHNEHKKATRLLSSVKNIFMQVQACSRIRTERIPHPR